VVGPGGLAAVQTAHFFWNHQPLPLVTTAGYNFWRISSTSGARNTLKESIGKSIVKVPMAQALQKLAPTGNDTEIDSKRRLEAISVEILCILLERRLAEESSNSDELRSRRSRHRARPKTPPDRAAKGRLRVL
jgi:hypothetical protein